MLDLWFMPQREPLDMIECLDCYELSFIPSVVIENLAKCHNWISWLDLINTIPLFDLISFILWSKFISSILSSDLIKSYFFIIFN